VNPAASNATFRSGIFAFIGLTPRRKAAYRGMGRKISRGVAKQLRTTEPRKARRLHGTARVVRAVL
jgi:hypothetical protein